MGTGAELRHYRIKTLAKNGEHLEGSPPLMWPVGAPARQAASTGPTLTCLALSTRLSSCGAKVRGWATPFQHKHFMVTAEAHPNDE